MSLPSIPIPRYDDVDPASLEFRRVTAEGLYQPSPSFQVGPRPYEGQSGYFLIHPFAVYGGDTILVNRGWVPDPAEAPPLPTKPVRIQGMLRLSERSNRWTPENNPAQEQWFWKDLPAMAGVAGRNVKPWIIEDDGKEGQTLPVAGIHNTAFHNNHVTYIATWYSLTLALSVIFLKGRSFASSLKRRL